MEEDPSTLRWANASLGAGTTGLVLTVLTAIDDDHASEVPVLAVSAVIASFGLALGIAAMVRAPTGSRAALRASIAVVLGLLVTAAAIAWAWLVNGLSHSMGML